MDDQGSANPEYYLSHIAAYDAEFKTWEERARKIIRKYRDDKRAKGEQARFNVLWSNVQTLKAATYARMPRPDVSRRFRDQDPVGRVAALLIERALDFEVSNYPDFAQTMSHVVYDRFLSGRGTAWVRYEPITRMEDAEPDILAQLQQAGMQSGEPATEATDTPTQVEVLDFECAPVDYVHWDCFGHSIARTWEEVGMVWRKIYMSRKALTERFGEDGASVPLDALPDEQKSRNSSELQSVSRKGLVYEIWDKDEGKVVWLSKSLGTILDERDDPLELEGFFPCPRPIFATLTTDTLIPIPDFTLYQDQAEELDLLADRIQGLIQSLKVVGCYDASIPELARIFKEARPGDLIPVKNWQAFSEKQGLAGALSLVEIEPIARALTEAYQAFEQVKSQIYELTGVSDILRGETAPSETATAQQIKNSYASLRLKVYQDEVERFASDLFRIKAQILCSKFEDATLLQMCGAGQLATEDQQMIPQALQMIRSNVMRAFRIEVETDSMAYQDEQQEKGDRMAFLQATSNFIQQVAQASEATPQLAKLGGELLKFGVTGFRVGRTLEGVIDAAVEQMDQAAAQAAQNPKPDPAMAKVQADQQASQAKLQADQQTNAMQLQHEQQLAQFKAQLDTQTAQAKAQADAQSEQQRLAFQAQTDEVNRRQQEALEQMKAQTQERMQAAEVEFNRWKAQLDAETKILVAQIQAEAGMRQAAMSAALTPKPDKGDGEAKPEPKQPDVAGALQTALEGFQEAITTLRQPRTVVRDGEGRITGVQ